MRRNWGEEEASVKIAPKFSQAFDSLRVYEECCDAAYLSGLNFGVNQRGELLDAVPNNFGWMLLSPRVCAALSEMAPAQVCLTSIYIDVTDDLTRAIADYRLLSTNCVVPCLDEGSEGIVWSAVNPSCVSHFHYVPLRRGSLPKDKALFTVLKLPFFFAVDERIRSRLEAMRVTGIRFVPCVVN
jgi:hypothetical protein